jgi:hypothetical protein
MQGGKSEIAHQKTLLIAIGDPGGTTINECQLTIPGGICD